jgi:putative oxygen-independent coproporphyrinogen III oxidase
MGFADAICRELETMRGRTGPRDVASIFFGGGTPSLMPVDAVGQILDRIGALWTCASDIEVTLEANPTSVEADRFRGYRASGVNRVSLGVQSLRDSDLKALGRLHDAAEARAAIALAQSCFPRMSFDIIYSRMGQSLSEWRVELAEVLALAGEHLSLYQLTIEPETPFAALHDAGKLVVPDNDLARDLFDLTQQMTSDAGLPAYEISNHAAPGAECRHNQVYWRCGDYVGAGPGAHGRITEDGVRMATATERNPEVWRKMVEQQGQGLIINESLDTEEVADEFLVMGLRLAEGIDPARYQTLSGRRFDPGRVSDLKNTRAHRRARQWSPCRHARRISCSERRRGRSCGGTSDRRDVRSAGSCAELTEDQLDSAALKAAGTGRNHPAGRWIDLQNCKPAIVQPIRPQSEQSICSGKSIAIGQNLGWKWLLRVPAGQSHGEPHGIKRQAGNPWRWSLIAA